MIADLHATTELIDYLKFHLQKKVREAFMMARWECGNKGCFLKEEAKTVH